ncbi:NAD-dependent epimerase/dehydratase family protein [Poritiphilus flavus]|uniref:UDP-glucose 4-epimerase n=1 Tax=Poritiphilus flavus TaxID=2697053 RepID=A0A6L9EI38_9FLAO|nr:NAD-dependent epimerase/dehydratase family protein [Poritiphilus flavus]NAS14316.1 NAD-dependent epimerase/dehydratase family protein [Poritiphilus flavus]
MKRRHFIETLGAGGLLLSASPLISCSNTSRPLNILVLGGTDFLGPAIVKAGIQKGHKITLFNRGITNPKLFAELPLIKGDREKGAGAYRALQEQRWDAVIDVWPQQSGLVDEATSALQSHTGHYLFISSVAVYKDFNEPFRAEDYPVVTLPEDRSSWGYSEEKVASEALVSERFADNHTILRPGPIKGWRDPAYDLLYWLIKLERNESILAPGDGSDPVQFIDVNDVGRFAITAVEQKEIGKYNCVGPAETLSWKAFLEAAKAHLGSSSELVWSDREFLSQNKVYAWESLPLWAPITDDYFMKIGNSKSVAAGFTYASLGKTIEDCLQWHRENGDPNITFGQGDQPIGISREKELEVIKILKG